jgi:antitoxin HigA-1
MEMKNPVHPGLLVKDCIEELGLSVAEASKGLGVTRQQLYNVIAGRSCVTPEMAIRLEKAFGSTAGTWLRMQMNYDLAQIRTRASSIAVERFMPKSAHL